MAKRARLALALFVIFFVALLALPAERMPRTGQWLGRAGLTQLTARVGRLEVRYVRKGAGPTLILVHGLASSMYTWSEVIEPLSRSFDVIAIDLPGFGASSQPADLSVEDLSGVLPGLMGELGISRAHLVGNSLGGGLSLLLAARQPALVDRLVILDSTGIRMQPSDRPFMIRVLGSRSAGFLGERLPVRRALITATLRRLIHDDTRLSAERIDEYTAPLLREGALASAQSLLGSPLDPRFIPDLRSIEAPTLVVWGRFDHWLPEADADLFVAAIRGARKVIVETGHMPQEERPAEIARLVGEFLSS
jgi:abhydrolase domain-containing protein 6